MPSLRITESAEDRAAPTLRPWSWRLLAVAAVVWSFFALAFFVSWLPEADPTGPSVLSGAIWYGLSYALWIPLSQAVFFLVQRFPVTGAEFRRNLPRHALAAVLLAMTHVIVFFLLLRASDPDFHLRYPSLAVAFKTNFLIRTLTGSVTYGVVLFVLSADATLRRVREDERRTEELRRRLAEAELQALRMQIQPHFLFNTLHSINSLVQEDPGLAQAMIARLGDFLRATLERGSAETLSFQEELTFTELYLEIEKVRFGERLRIAFEIDPNARTVETPSLVLQPLVENAVRHGVAPALRPVDLVIAAVKRNGNLEISLTNVEAGGGSPRPRRNAGEGLGLANTRARLERMYGARASLDIDESASGGFAVTIRIPAGDDVHA